MQVAQKRIKVTGLAGALAAMRKWVAKKSRTPVSFQPVTRRGHTVVIRLEPDRSSGGRRKHAL